MDFFNKVVGGAAEEQLADQIGSLAKKGAEVVIDKMQAGGEGGSDAADKKEDEGKGGILSGFLGGGDDKKEGGGGFDIGDLGKAASGLLK